MQEAHEAWHSMWRCVPQGNVHQQGDEDGSRVHLEVSHRSRSLVRPVLWKGEKPTGWQIGGGLHGEEELKAGRRMSKKRSVSLEACCSLYWRGVLLPGQPAGPWLVFGAALQMIWCSAHIWPPQIPRVSFPVFPMHCLRLHYRLHHPLTVKHPGDGGQSAFIAWLLFCVSRWLWFSVYQMLWCLPFCIFTFSTVAIITPVSRLHVHCLRCIYTIRLDSGTDLIFWHAYVCLVCLHTLETVH